MNFNKTKNKILIINNENSFLTHQIRQNSIKRIFTYIPSFYINRLGYLKTMNSDLKRSNKTLSNRE